MLPWITIFRLLVMRFDNDFHSWLRHLWIYLVNRLTRGPKIVIHGNSCIILYMLNHDLSQVCTWLFFYVYIPLTIQISSGASECVLAKLVMLLRYGKSYAKVWKIYDWVQSNFLSLYQTSSYQKMAFVINLYCAWSSSNAIYYTCIYTSVFSACMIYSMEHSIHV